MPRNAQFPIANSPRVGGPCKAEFHAGERDNPLRRPVNSSFSAYPDLLVESDRRSGEAGHPRRVKEGKLYTEVTVNMTLPGIWVVANVAVKRAPMKVYDRTHTRRGRLLYGRTPWPRSVDE